jgi:hypothetical protein
LVDGAHGLRVFRIVVVVIRHSACESGCLCD